MPSVLGIDLGGTKAALARYDAHTWEEQARATMPTEAKNGFGQVFDRIIAKAEDLMASDTVAVGMGVPGLVQQPKGTIQTLPNVPDAEGFALKNTMEARLQKPAFVENDGNCFTLAEALQGAGTRHRIVVGVAIGTGVGGGIVMDGHIFHGTHGYAGEIGHMLLRPGEPPFVTADARGDAEQFLSGRAMGQRCSEAQDPREYLEGRTCAFMHRDLCRELAWLLTGIIHIIDPSVIVIGGSAGRAFAPHLHEVREELERWVLPKTPQPDIAIATVGDAALRGAALLALAGHQPA